MGGADAGAATRAHAKHTSLSSCLR